VGARREASAGGFAEAAESGGEEGTGRGGLRVRAEVGSRLRAIAHLSRFASKMGHPRWLGVDVGHPSGEKHPQGASLKLLSLVEKKGLESVA
jgi:hypothetical protein